MKTLKIIELFGGIGAPRAALQNIGITVDSDYVEIDNSAVKSYNALYNCNHEPTDVKQYTPSDSEYDLLVGGFPCQDISTAGNMRGMSKESNTRSNLAWELVRVVKECKPKVVIIENVANLLSNRFKKDFDLFIKELTDLSYNVNYKVLNATDFGVPQNRKRLFIVCTTGTISFDFENLKSSLQRSITQYINFETLDTSTCSVNQATTKGYADMIVPGVANLSFASSTTRRGRVINEGQTSPTLLTSPEVHAISIRKSIDERLDNDICGIPISKYNVRKLTPIEYWKLMGFSEKQFELVSSVNSSSQLYKQAGNSIVVDVLESMFAELYKTMLDGGSNV